MNILTQNGKMKKSSQNGIDVYNFGIPAFKSETGLITCPNARHCVSGCYARSGTYRFKNVVNAYEQRLKLTQDPSFCETMVAAINLKTIQSKAKGNQCLIRIHDSGDFYSNKYAMNWLNVIHQCPLTQFYAYTKMVQMFVELERLKMIPSNLRLIYSYGGSEDSHIDTSKHYHSKVFQSETELLAAQYVDASNDDLVAALGSSRRIGLVYHGLKSYSNTQWNKVI
jgi:hypothetical protein